MTTAMYAGSFDPVHLGHLSVIRASAARFDAVFVVVAGNPSKTGGMFLADQRVTLTSAATADLANVTVMGHSGLLLDAAAVVHADVLIRSASKERASEMQMACINRLDRGIPTILVPADPTTAHISSSAIRALVAHGSYDAARQLLPPVVADALDSPTGRLPPQRHVYG